MDPLPARDCPALEHSGKLWELKGLKDVGILTQQQFESQVQFTLKQTEPGAPSEAPPVKKRIHASLLKTAPSVPLPKQKSLFASGFWKEKTTENGEVLRIDGDAQPISSPPVTHKCRFCDYRHEYKCSLALHEKKHPQWTKGCRPVDEVLTSFSTCKSAESNSVPLPVLSSRLKKKDVEEQKLEHQDLGGLSKRF